MAAGLTKKAIQDSFIKLLNEKPLSRITIREIVDDCGVNRNTFYYYFQDLPQLVEWIVDEAADSIISEYPEIESIEECLKAAISFAMENRKAVLHIYNSVNRNLYEHYLWRVCEHVVTRYIDGILLDRSISGQDYRLLTGYLKSLCFGIVMAWMDSGMQGDVQEDFYRICELKQGQLEQMIERCHLN